MKFSIVTPSYQKAPFISQAIDSVITQGGDFSIEYLVLDNCSCDGTREILESYRRRIEAGDFPLRCRGVSFSSVSERDGGMYHALRKGFSRASGDLHAWINADDLYLPGAFAAVAATFRKYPQIRWLKGITCYIDDSGSDFRLGECHLYHRPWIAEGIYGREAYFIQQDSVFWSSSLWHDAGGIDIRHRLAGDYHLWRAFAACDALYSLNLPVSCFRAVTGQLSEDRAAYSAECLAGSPNLPLWRRAIGGYFANQHRLSPALRPLAYRLLFGEHAFHLVEMRQGTPHLTRPSSYLAATPLPSPSVVRSAP